jgi:CRP-like cAMP-binding protein
MSGAAVIMRAEQSPHASMVQVGNPTAYSIPSDRLLEACDTSASLRRLLMRYVQSLNVQAALTAASNAHYALPERLARWLLMCHDRSESDRMELTHEFLSMMLAVRRSGVTVTLHTLEATGAIRSARGVVTVTNRERLEEIAGDAYGEAEAEYRRLIGPFGRGKHGMVAVH